MKIRPVSDLRNKFPKIEAELNESAQPLANYNAKTSKVSKDRPKSKSGLGLLSSYADPDKIEYEKLAGKLHALKKFGGVANE